MLHRCTVSLVTDLKLEYKTFVLILPPIYSLDKSVLVAQSQSQSADLRWLISHKIIMYNEHRLPGVPSFSSVTEVSKCMMPSV